VSVHGIVINFHYLTLHINKDCLQRDSANTTTTNTTEATRGVLFPQGIASS
jgi:hypothetical protein